eukprot:GEMP01005016.1.p1 GENE.GEMP01005016.1~~GEMP01005016.1.p1  ORF type:complete len:481 (+),score=91.26 GEMP01005016.1:981-2423(+)
MGGFGALTYLQHCGDFITSVALLGAHFNGTLDEKIINSVYDHGIEMETFDAIIKNCKELRIRMWMLHGTEDKTCSYTDMLLFFHYCQMHGYNDVGLQIDGFDKPLKSHTGPYDWMFGEDRSKYSPNPLGAFCAYPYNYDDSKDFLPKATPWEKQSTTPKCSSSSSVSSSDLRASVESVHAYDASFPALSGSTPGNGGEKIRSSSNFSTEPPPSWSYIPAAAAPPPPVIVPTYEESFPALNSSTGERSRRSSNFSTKARLPPPRSSDLIPAPAPPPASAMLTYEESFPPLSSSSGACVRPPPRTTYIPPPPVDSIPTYDPKPSEGHCPIPPSCSTVSSLRTTASTLPPCTSDPMSAHLDDPAADSDAACPPSHQETNEGTRAVQNAPRKQKRGKNRSGAYGAASADRRAKDKGWRGNDDWSYLNGEHKGEKDKWNYDCSYYHEEQKERRGRGAYSWGNNWKYYDGQEKNRGERYTWKSKWE